MCQPNDPARALFGADDIPGKSVPEVLVAAAALTRLRHVFGGTLPDDVTIARTVLAAATKLRREAAPRPAEQEWQRAPDLNAEHGDRTAY